MDHLYASEQAARHPHLIVRDPDSLRQSLRELKPGTARKIALSRIWGCCATMLEKREAALTEHAAGFMPGVLTTVSN